ncbi:uncharacterized protein LOC110628634 [Manihot esculenta]|uniref:uncharacterized protein LOC110628634 n=1 Tax=Manihot esculenta TaxID=3983 RepID=UPI000B5D55BF|nr:uncharacterized protein LOC110628634 [Manihot esculenta]
MRMPVNWDVRKPIRGEFRLRKEDDYLSLNQVKRFVNFSSAIRAVPRKVQQKNVGERWLHSSVGVGISNNHARDGNSADNSAQNGENSNPKSKPNGFGQLQLFSNPLAVNANSNPLLLLFQPSLMWTVMGL